LEDELGTPIKALGIQNVGRVKAKQVQGVPHHPVENLFPCFLGDGLQWAMNDHGLSAGITVRSEGRISYAPAMIARLRIKDFHVYCEFLPFRTDTIVKMQLVYFDKHDNVHQIDTPPFNTSDMPVNRWGWQIPLEHIDQANWFTCSLTVQLRTPMPEGPERDLAISQGFEEPSQPLLVRGCWLEIKG